MHMYQKLAMANVAPDKLGKDSEQIFGLNAQDEEESMDLHNSFPIWKLVQAFDAEQVVNNFGVSEERLESLLVQCEAVLQGA
jgi:hypothetical protein